MSAPKLLVVTRHSPLPGNDGAGAYLFDLLRYLHQRGALIEVVWVKAEGAFVDRGWWRIPREVSAVARVTVVGSLAVGRFRFFWWGRLKAQALGAVKATLIALGLWPNAKISPGPKTSFGDGSRPPIPISSSSEPAWSELPSTNEIRFFRQRLRAFQPDAVLANYCWMLPMIPRNHAGTKFVLTHDVASHRLNLLGDASMHPAGEYSPATLAGETRLLELADVILAISEDDAAVFRGMVPGHAVLSAPKASVPHPHTSPTVRGRCLFVGGVNGPNHEGLLWFLDRIWPLVHREHPHAVFHVCGGICEIVTRPLPAGVVLRGRVESLDREYGDAEVVVVPLLVGTGVKIKLVEACSHGRACVTTPVGLQGLSCLRESVLESVDPHEFARQVVRLLDDSSLRLELQHRAFAAVQAHLAPDRCYEPVWTALRSPPLRSGTHSAPRALGSPERAGTERKTFLGQFR